MILLLIAVLAAAFATRLPTVLAAVTAPSRLAALYPHTVAMLRTPQIILAASYGLATVGSLRRSRQCHDELSNWLAISAVLAVAAHLNYFSVQELAYLLRNIDSLNGTVDKDTKTHLRRAAELDMVEVRL